MPEPLTSNATDVPGAARPRLRLGFLRNLTLLGLLALLWLGLALGTDSFATIGNFQNLLRQASIWAIMAVGQTFVVITAGIDLSAGAVVGIAGTLVALLMKAGVPVPAAVMATLALGAAIGWCHAFGIVRMGLPPFIMTLASLTALRGIGLLMTNGQTIAGLPTGFSSFARGEVAGVPNLFLAVIAVAVPCHVLLHHSRWGRYLYAVGSNREAARLSGVRVGRVLYLAYILSATLSALAGVLTTARIGIGVATTGDGWELQAIASSVIGGASLFGAVGSVPGPLLGAMLLTTINNGANLLNVNPFWQRIITGALIVAIVYLDQARRPKR
ncbi:monosaccharide-transporting ATPase [Aliidongia dinghuensis]|uniref:Monosaccharide-transporting ATPase n=1 Tax=Aliidongia dinghuensis TaxID=1867774 RepID=A0A8J3E508_9PROT|nr:ABC transporter permease [Aliidongia dinghuensis]GGF18393.1 monosaccharide-transporting ATPase [Aliidongia dinghuensis]